MLMFQEIREWRTWPNSVLNSGLVKIQETTARYLAAAPMTRVYLLCVGNQIHDRNDFKEVKVYFGSQFEGCLRSMVVGKTKVCDKSLSHVVDQKAQHSDQNHKQEPSKFCPQ